MMVPLLMPLTDPLYTPSAINGIADAKLLMHAETLEQDPGIRIVAAVAAPGSPMIARALAAAAPATPRR